MIYSFVYGIQLDAYELVISLHDGNVSCKRSSSVAPYGRCYAISDGTPIDNFEFLKPLCEARLCEFPTLTIPTPAVICFAYLCEKMYFFFKLLGIQVEPFLTRSEVYKVLKLSVVAHVLNYHNTISCL